MGRKHHHFELKNKKQAEELKELLWKLTSPIPKMRINFNLFNLTVSGGNRVVFELANGLTEKGHEVSITAIGSKHDHDWYGEINATINYIPFSLSNRLIRHVFHSGVNFNIGILAHKLVDYLKTIPDCDANIATFCLTAYPTLFCGKGKPFYLVQNYEPWVFNTYPHMLRMAEITYDLPMTKLVVSNWLEEKVGGKFVGNGVNLMKYYPKPDVEKEPTTVMAIMRGIDWKGGDLTIIDTMTELHEQIPTIKLLCVGNDTVCTKLQLTGYGFNLETIPEPDDEELLEAYCKASVVLFVSKFEGFGLVPLEAMACGTPVVTTVPCKGLDEYVINDYNALAVSEHDLASAIKTALFNNSLRDKLIAGGIETASKLRFNKVVDRTEKILKEAIG